MEDVEDQSKSFLRPNSSTKKSNRNHIKAAIVIGVLVVFLIVVTILVILWWPHAPRSANGRYKHAAVASDAAQCSTIGKNILHDKNGSAVDAAVATLFCLGVHSAMSCGIGGGVQIVIYDKPKNGSQKIFKVFDARETAPAAATKDMFVNETSQTFGGKVIAVPGEVRGYYEAWQQFGRLPWEDLVSPTVDLCRNGFHVGPALARYISLNENLIRNNTGLRKLYVKDDGSLYKENDIMKNQRLADVLEKIQKNPDALYTGSLANDIVSDIKDHGGIITLEDLRNYKVVSDAGLSMELRQSGHRLHTLGLPSSGVLFGFMLRILEGYNLTSRDVDGTSKAVEAYHKIVETFKFGYAMRSHLGDEQTESVLKMMESLQRYDFADSIRNRINLTHTQNVSYYDPEFISSYDHGTSHLSIIAPGGGAVSATSTINSVFGSKLVGERTGVIFNDEMSDFVTPGDPSSLGQENFIRPGKRPMSSMCPGIIVDKNDNVLLVIGAAGGKQITSASVYMMAHYLWLGKKIDGAVDILRLHHQLEPNKVTYEPTFPKGVLGGLTKKGHVLDETGLGFPSVIQVIESSCHRPDHPEECLTAVCDHRKKGQPDGF